MGTAKVTFTFDNEIELDLLLKEELVSLKDLQGMDVGACHHLLEYWDCHAIYHQECHQPSVTPTGSR